MQVGHGSCWIKYTGQQLEVRQRRSGNSRQLATMFPQQPRYYPTGFSQNAMFAGYAGVCFADKVQGIAQGKITHLCADKTRQHDDDDNDDDDVLNL